MAFDLFLFVKEQNCLAFRFEPPDKPNWSHNYPHVQLSRDLLHRTVKPKGIPSWLPDSYPAFPLPSSDPLKMFLSLVTAVHGRHKGFESILVEMFQTAGRSIPYLYQAALIGTHSPLSMTDRHDLPWLIDELVPGLATP